ncbi:unnamed protein product [Darwinula stevensoni]|uniref:Septin-type G domain-containing protein n=1 Tax=Darwinula stevensoni TaxID=69355 RepID=A0A7R8XES8_9CRUS|nr:unnamed protein product [Darwinula stevensoni]CAG0896104.1 unnamed protein product [Darwinula stevensoni]
MQENDGRQLEWLKANSRLRELDGKVAIYEVKMNVIPVEEGLEKRVIGSDHKALYASTRYILVIGRTGAGKTTFINALFNYFVGVDYDDAFRFIIASSPNDDDQAQSQTKNVTAYTIQCLHGCRFRYSLTIVDTPGFGDTVGKEEEEINWLKVQKLFTSKEFGLDRLHLVAFVVPSSEQRLSANNENIYAKVTSIFGKDVENNFHIVVTHCDMKAKKEHPVMKTLRKAGIPSQFGYYVNLQGILTKDKDDQQEKYAWKTQKEELHKMCEYLDEGLTPVSLTLTKENLKKLQDIEATLRKLEYSIQEKSGRNRRTTQEFEEEMKLAKELHETFEEHKSRAMKPYLPYIRQFICILLEKDQETLKIFCGQMRTEHIDTYEKAKKKVEEVLREKERKRQDREKGLLSRFVSLFGFK